jgi:AcrR family transcriptional regulator
MEQSQQKTCKVGRPRRGTELERLDVLIQSATRIFLKEGYGLASIDKIATEAGISTRTIYERFKNKADLMAAVVERLCNKDLVQMFGGNEIDDLAPAAALSFIANTIINRCRDPDSAALFRIIACEAQRFPELTAKVRRTNLGRLDHSFAMYLRRQTERGVLAVANPELTAKLFFHLISGEIHDYLLYEPPDAVSTVDWDRHVANAVQLFLHGAAPRSTGEGESRP